VCRTPVFFAGGNLGAGRPSLFRGGFFYGSAGADKTKFSSLRWFLKILLYNKGRIQNFDREATFMMSGFSEDLKKIFLAGLGAAAVTTEKSKQIVDELVKKGELTIEQGKVLNEELKHTVQEKVKEHVTVNVTVPGGMESVKEAVAKMSPQDLEAVKAKIAEVEQAKQEEAGGAQKDAGV
jgi:polyhydroxyalkanoate synthesis regulator phasin